VRSYSEFGKMRRLNDLLDKFRGQWIFLVDSDEFVELPYPSLDETIRGLESANVNCLAAPMLQRIRLDGSLHSSEIVRDPFADFPLCSQQLYKRMGSLGARLKFPLFQCTPETNIQIGNHFAPSGAILSEEFRGVTHHFKWRRTVIERLSYMVEIGWPWAETESAPYLRYLEAHNYCLPLEGAFMYSRDELCRRGLLKRPL
jgi:hypothetical protein